MMLFGSPRTRLSLTYESTFFKQQHKEVLCFYCLITQQKQLSLMIGKFKDKRLKEQKDLEKKNTSDVITAQKRMRFDIQKYNDNRIDNVNISYPNEGSVTELHILIAPNQQRSFYRNSRITFLYRATEKYPYQPPEVKCLNKILHPNIDQNGNVCLNLLRSGWKPIYEMHLVVIGLLHLLENIKAADLEEPLDRDAAALMSKDIEEFDKVVQETIKGKSYFGRQFDNVYYVPKKK